MKHFFNRRDAIVTEALDGLLLTSGEGRLCRLDTYPSIKVIVRADWDGSKVAVISGGGAGHEPSHAGFVGRGMLTAAVSGEIFASPSVEAVLTAIRAVTGPKGALLIVKNYTGDRLNFGLAAEKARTEGFDVEMVIVADDIALPNLSQPRGIAGTLFVHKIAGHLAETGADLAIVAQRARTAAGDIVSLGMALSSCSVPGQEAEARLGPDEGELGLGIHGEPGVERIAMQPVEGFVALMAERLAATLDPSAEHALLINNLGAVPPLEMSVIARTVLGSPSFSSVRLILGPGPLMTALDMNGFSLSLIRLDAERMAALTSPVAPHAWLPPVARHAISVIAAPAAPSSDKALASGKTLASRKDLGASENAAARRTITAVCERLIAEEEALNRLDARVGDGDTGSTVATGARSILAVLDRLPLADTAATLNAIGDTLATSMGGSSGVLLSIFFTAAARAMTDRADLSDALSAGLARMTFYSGAAIGDRTMVDALVPALAALCADGPAAAAVAAKAGAASTTSMRKANAGRSAYIGERDLDGIADPGAVAVAEAFAAAAEAVRADQA